MLHPRQAIAAALVLAGCSVFAGMTLAGDNDGGPRGASGFSAKAFRAARPPTVTAKPSGDQPGGGDTPGATVLRAAVVGGGGFDAGFHQGGGGMDADALGPGVVVAQ